MSRFRRNARGLSEIIGALMLIVIVIGAAVALAAFVATEEKQAQTQEAAEQQRALEDLKVLSVVPQTYPYGSNQIGSVNFTVTSLDTNPTMITGLRIDQQGVESYNATEVDPKTGLLTWITVADGGSLSLGGFDVVNIVINTTVGSPWFSFFDSSFQLTSTDYIEIELTTSLANDFEQTFVPPSAIAVVSTFSEYSGGGYVTVPELDGSSSFQPENGTVVSWTWNVSFPAYTALNGTCTQWVHDPFTLLGEKVVPSLPCTDATYSVKLTVQNSFGLIGVATATYVDP